MVESFLDQYVGKEVSISTIHGNVLGKLARIDYDSQNLVVLPFLNFDGAEKEAYVEGKSPFLLGLACFRSHAYSIRPLRDGHLEERFAAINKDLSKRSKIGFEN